MLILVLLAGAGKGKITFGRGKVKNELGLVLRPRRETRCGSKDSIIAVVLGLSYTFDVD